MFAWTNSLIRKSKVAAPGHHLDGNSSPSPARLRKQEMGYCYDDKLNWLYLKVGI